ncbi:MAG TPA: HD domain-containing phosphohydrolase, partial [Phycisphaerae bacterium]|nr:HD domain-containing phosphohydrolase [Phycisphaerae bacterium]
MTHRKEAPPTAALGRAYNSARLGFIPVPLQHAPLHVLTSVSVYVRSPAGGSAEPQYALYREPAFPFTEEDRARLLAHGVRFVYVEMAEQRHVQRCVEAAAATGADVGACGLVYSATVELINELLVTPDLEALGPRLEDLSRTVAGLVVDHPGSFAHLFKVARHDFYTATHVVNVATWMVPLAYACGLRDPAELAHVFQAGILHDIGKVFVPAELLNRPGALSEEDWRILRGHPQIGYDHLRGGPGLSEAVLRVAHEHHERDDGGGYPRGLRAAHLHPVSRICAVVDTFEAMTALRPHRRRAHPLSHAVDTLRTEAGTR